MTPIKTMASAIVLAALGTNQPAAQSLSGNATAGGSASVDSGSTALGADAGASIGAQANTATATGTANDTSASAVAAITAAAEAAIAAGNAQVVSSNDAVLGTISAVETDTTGQVRYTVDVAEYLGLETDRVTLVSRSRVGSDGSLKVAMTEEEFALAASQRTDAEAGGSADMD